MVKTLTKTETPATSLDAYRSENYNVLVPTTHMQQISPFHIMRVEEVRINPTPEAGEVFKVGSRMVNSKWEDILSPAKPALMKLSNAAGIIWDWRNTRVITATRDYVLYEAVGAMRKPSGEWIPLKASKEIDMVVIEEEVYESNIKKAKALAAGSDKDKKKLGGMTPEEYAQALTKANMIQWRKNKLARAETGAMLRVIRALLNLKMQYSPSELQKPFIVPRVDFSPDYTDPEVRRMIAQEGIKATADLFGQAASHAQGLPPAQTVNQAFSVQELPQMTAPISVDAISGIDEDITDTETDTDEPPPWAEGDEEQSGQQSFKDAIICQGCDEAIEQTGDWSPENIAAFSKKKYGKVLCPNCQNKKVGDKK